MPVVNIGASANDGTGDDLRTAFGAINDKFDALDAFDAGLPDVTPLRMSADYVATSNSTTLQDIPSLASAALPAGRYRLEGIIPVVAGTTCDFKMAFVAPTGTTGPLKFTALSNSATASNGPSYQAVWTGNASWDSATGEFSMGGIQPSAWKGNGVEVNGEITLTTAGVIKFQIAQDTASATETVRVLGISFVNVEAIS